MHRRAYRGDAAAFPMPEPPVRLPILLLLCACAIPARADQAKPDEPAQGHRNGVQMSSDQCGLSTPYNVLVDTGGIWLYRDQGAPREIFFHGGTLSIDGQVQAVDAADAQRLWQMEAGAQQLMPQVASVAGDVVDITYDALASVIDVLTGSAANARKIERRRKQARAYVDATLGRGRWDQEVFGEQFEQRVQREAEEFTGSITRHILWQVFTGRSEQIDARAERMDEELDKRMDAKSDALEAKARALCPQVRELYALQSALDYRYQGQPLRMIALDAPAGQAAPASPQEGTATPAADNGDHRDTAVTPATPR